MAVFYQVFGLGLRANQDIAGLEALPKVSAVDVRIWLNSPDMKFLKGLEQRPFYESPFKDAHGEPTLRMWKVSPGGYYQLRYRDGTEFFLDPSGSRVWGQAPEGATPEDLAIYLLGPVLGFLLRLRGITCLHASAVMVDNSALAFLGPPGAGKSTLAAAMTQMGYMSISDDVVPLREKGNVFLAISGIPRLCLWPAAVAHLYGSPEALPRLIPENSLDPGWDKRWLDLSRVRPQSFPPSPPLGAVYCLGDRQAEADFRVEPLSPGTGLMTLVANAYRSELLDKDLRAQEFATLARLVTQVPLRRVIPPTDLARLPRLCEAILEDFRGLNTPAFRQKTRLR